MNVASPSVRASESAATLRIALGDDHKVSTVALDLVRAAAEFQHRQVRGEDTSGLIAELSERFNIDPRVAQALLAGQVKTEVDGDHLVVCATLPADVEQSLPTHPRSCLRPMATNVGPEERARRMQSVMLFHCASRGVSEQGGDSPSQLMEFLCDLRHWCDERMVDLYKGLDQSYIRYMHNKYRGLPHNDRP